MAAGTILGERFELEGLAGEGGMGRVFRARDRVTGDPVAVKILRAGAARGERFDREVQLLSTLQHPAIVRHVGHGRCETGEPYLAMEWLDGCDLAAYLGRHRVTIAEAVSLVRGVAEALAVAHERGIAHRDVKPQNIFLVDRDPARVRVLDFGTASIVTERGMGDLLRSIDTAIEGPPVGRSISARRSSP